jgi:hypothetical protein
MEDNFDDFNFEEYMEHSQNEWDEKMEQWRERMVLQAIEANYINIEKNGISDWHARHLEGDELKQLKETIEFMIEHYVESEQYERCSVLNEELKKINSLLIKQD